MSTGRPEDRSARSTDYTVGPLASGLDVLLEFEEGDIELRPADLARRLGVTRNKAYRLIKTLESRGFLQRVDDRYRLGIRLFTLGQRAAEPLELLRAAAQPELEALATQTGETAYLLVLDGADAMCVASIESQHYLRLSAAVGRRRPLHAGAGQKVLLADLDDERLAKHLIGPLEGFTASTIVDASQLRRELDEIRRRGYSTSIGEVDSDAAAVAAPVRDSSGRAVAALVVGGAVSRVLDHLNGPWSALVLAAARQISSEIGTDRRL